MKIAVTGATGFLGKYLIAELSKHKNAKITLFSSSMNKLIETFNDDRELFEFVETDYSIDSLEKNFCKYDVIIHLAAKRLSVDKSLTNYVENIIVTENLLKLSDRFGVGKIIFASSQGIYCDCKDDLPFKEDNGYGYGYGYSKFICEQISRFYRTPFISLRFGQIIGWGEREGFMFTTQLNKIKKNEPLVLWGEGGGGRDYLYAKDAVSAIVRCFKDDVVNDVSYNVSMGVPYSFKDFAETLVSVFGNEESRIVFDKTKVEDKNVRYMSIHKIKHELSWEPRFTLMTAFEDMKNEVM